MVFAAVVKKKRTASSHCRFAVPKTAVLCDIVAVKGLGMLCGGLGYTKVFHSRESNDYYNTTIMASMRFGVNVIKVRGRIEELSKLRELRSPRPVLR